MIESPCTGICEIVPAAAVCRGCARSLDEIARWGSTDDADRRRIVADLPRRLALLKDVA